MLRKLRRTDQLAAEGKTIGELVAAIEIDAPAATLYYWRRRLCR